MSFKTVISSLLAVLAFTSCNKQQQAAKSKVQFGDSCNVRIEVSGEAPEVQFTLYNSAKEKVVTIDKAVDVLDDKKDEFSISSYEGGKIQCSLKTKDSYGPKVKLKVFVNNKLWKEEEGSYNPKIEGEIPMDF